MITDVDTCLKDIADWYVRNRREITPPELQPILLKHCGSEAEAEKFTEFLETEPGQLRFKTLLRERKEATPEKPGFRRCRRCSGTGWDPELGEYCTGCGGMGWVPI